MAAEHISCGNKAHQPYNVGTRVTLIAKPARRTNDERIDYIAKAEQVSPRLLLPPPSTQPQCDRKELTAATRRR